MRALSSVQRVLRRDAQGVPLWTWFVPGLGATFRYGWWPGLLMLAVGGAGLAFGWDFPLF